MAGVLGGADEDLREGGQRLVTWKRPTLELSVSLRRGDDGLWEAAVTAFRE